MEALSNEHIQCLPENQIIRPALVMKLYLDCAVLPDCKAARHQLANRRGGDFLAEVVRSDAAGCLDMSDIIHTMCTEKHI